MNTIIARSAHMAFGFLLLTFLQACTSGGGDDVSPLQAPTIEPIAQAAGEPAGELTAEEGELLTFTVNASNDGPAPALSVTGLPPGANFDRATGVFDWIPADGDAERGPFEVTFTATDPIETGLSTNQTVNITVLPFGSGTFTAIPPVIEPNGGTFLDSVTVSMTTASDGATIFYTLDGSDPTESSNQYVDPFQLTEDTVVNARAFRGDLNNSNLSRAIFEVSPNALPVLNPIGNQTVIENQNLSFTVTATDAESTPVLRVTGLPPGATFDPASGAFSWTPEPGSMANSPYAVTFTAADGDNPDLVDTETISITVNNESPVLGAIGDRSVAETVPLSFTVSATDAESTPVLSATGLPAGATFDAATGLFSWTPAAGTASGSPYSVTFTATDAVDPNLTDSETIAITVGNDAPILNPIGNQTTFESQPLTFTVSASDTESTPVLSSSALPPGALFSAETGVFSWIPGQGTALGSPYSVTFTATDAVDPALTASETIAITVTSLFVPPPATVATPTISPNGGPFDGSVTVTITTATTGSTIRYTLDGSDPTTTSTAYTAPIAVTVDGTVVSARAFQVGFTNSERATSAPFVRNTVATPVISPNGGAFDESATVNITTATAGATIRYTVDGTDPTSLSTVYSAPITVPVDGRVVSARAFQTGLNDSERATSAPFTQSVTTANCTTAITSPLALDLQTSTNLVISATFTCDPAIPAGWGVRLDAVGVNNGASASEIEEFSPYTRTYTLPRDEYTITATVIDDMDNPVAGAAQAQVTPVGIGDYYVAFGDSITRGIGGSAVTSSDGRNSGNGYPPRLNNELTRELGHPHTVIEEGLPGESSAGGASRIADVLRENPEAQRVLVMYGMNDAGPPLPRPSGMGLSPCPGNSTCAYTGTFKDNMQQIISAIVASGREAVVARINIALGDSDTGPQYIDPPNGARSLEIQEYNQVIVSELTNRTLGPDFFDFYRFNPGQYSDNIHPNATGYQSMADLWRQVLAP